MDESQQRQYVRGRPFVRVTSERDVAFGRLYRFTWWCPVQERDVTTLSSDRRAPHAYALATHCGRDHYDHPPRCNLCATERPLPRPAVALLRYAGPLRRRLCRQHLGRELVEYDQAFAAGRLQYLPAVLTDWEWLPGYGPDWEGSTLQPYKRVGQ